MKLDICGFLENLPRKWKFLKSEKKQQVLYTQTYLSL